MAWELICCLVRPLAKLAAAEAVEQLKKDKDKRDAKPSSKPLDKHSTPIDRHYKQEVMTEASIRNVDRSRMDSLDVVSVY